MRKLATICSVLLLTAAPLQAAERLANEGKTGLYARSIDRVLRLYEEEIDLATAALLLSQQAGANINLQRYRDRIDDMAYTILERLDEKKSRGPQAGPPSGRVVVSEINKYLFDELGFRNVETADDSKDLFLHSVLDRKKGYCLSLSFLYLSIGERLGLPLYGVVVPGHFFVRYDDGKTRFNIETTSKGATPPDEYYIEKFKVPDSRQNIYMENLNKLQSLGCFFNNLGNFYQETGDLDAAMVQQQMAVQINPSVGMAHTNLGNIYLAKEMTDEAIYEYRLALTINPDDAKTRNNLGNAYFRKGWANEAISQYKISLRSDPNSIDVYKSLARAYASQDMFSYAISQLKTAMSLAPEDATVWVELGEVYRQMEDFNAAIFQYQKALGIKSDSIEARRGLAITYYKTGAIDNAVNEFKKVLSTKKYSAADNRYKFEARRALGNIYLEKEMYDAAIEEYQKAISLQNRDGYESDELELVYYNMAVALAIKKDYENAVSVYLAAIEIQPDLAEAYNGLGICYYHLKKYDLAWENLKKARMMGFEVQENFYEAVGRKAN